MATIRQLKRRIASIANTAKITNALQLVAASKMRRAQERALEARPYAEKLSSVLAGLSTGLEPGEAPPHPLLAVRPARTVALLHLTPNRGLCGGLNANLNRAAAAFATERKEEVAVVAVGKKGRDFFIRSGANVLAEFTDLGDYPVLADTSPITQLIVEDYLNEEVDRVYLSFPRFVNTAVQQPVVRQLLPIEPPQMESAEEAEGFRRAYILEPSPEELVGRLLPRFVEMQIYEAALELSASEQSARMVAMKNATDNANDIQRELTLTYNKLRQEQITKELLDIVGGATALEG